MPIPKPKKDERRDDYIPRCVSAIHDEYPKEGQAVAVCNQTWRTEKGIKEEFTKTFELEVEIFAIGKWNGMEFEKEDLNMISAAFASLKEVHQVPLKFGHNDEQQMTDGYPALGWVKDVWVEGTKLKARFTDVPKVVYDAMQAKLYRNVSVELDMGVEHKGNYYTWVLSGVALLGADIPAVNTLADLQTYMSRDELSFTKRMEFTAIQNESQNFERSDDMAGNEEEVVTLRTKVKAQNEEIDKLIDENLSFKRKTKEFDVLKEQNEKLTDENIKMQTELTELRAKFKVIEDSDKKTKAEAARKVVVDKLEDMVKEERIAPFTRDELMRDYDEAENKEIIERTVEQLEKTLPAKQKFAKKKDSASGNGSSGSAHSNDDSDESPDKIVSLRTKKYMRENGEKSFAVAKTKVLQEDPELAERYTKMEDA